MLTTRTPSGFFWVLVEAPPGLLAEPAGAHELLEDSRGCVVGLTELLVDVREDVQGYVEADKVPKLKRPYRKPCLLSVTHGEALQVTSVLLEVTLLQLPTSLRHPSSIAAAVFSTSSHSTSISSLRTPSSSISSSAASYQNLTSFSGSIPSSSRQKLPKASHKVRALFAFSSSSLFAISAKPSDAHSIRALRRPSASFAPEPSPLGSPFGRSPSLPAALQALSAPSRRPRR